MPKPKSTTIQRVSDRPGEGEAVLVTRHHSANPDGTTTLSLAIDMSSATVPDRRYVADIASVMRNGDMVKLIFGQSKVAGQGLRSLVVIHMAGLAVHQFLRSMPSLVKTMEDFSSQRKIAKADLANISEEPKQTVALAATVIVASISGRDGCLDFYYSSPYVAVQVAQGGKFVVDPVARVMLPMNLLHAIYKKLESMKVDLPDDITEAQP